MWSQEKWKQYRKDYYQKHKDQTRAYYAVSRNKRRKLRERANPEEHEPKYQKTWDKRTKGRYYLTPNGSLLPNKFAMNFPPYK